MTATTSGLVEREAELSVCSASVDDALAGNGTCVLVAGEAGTGKTSILDVTIGRAAERGMRVLRARAGELERHLPVRRRPSTIRAARSRTRR